MGFAERVQQSVLLFRDRVPHGPVLVVGNLDTDGITATSILLHALAREGITFASMIIKQISESFLDEIKGTGYHAVIFTDLGSGSISLIEEKLQGKNVFIFDHHYPEKRETQEWIVQLNPHLDGIDGTKDVSAAGVSYFFAHELNKENIDVAHLALIGAVGDVQEHMGFRGLNRDILRDALDAGTIEVKEGLRLFGLYTKPLCKVLEYSTHPYIPGVTGHADGAITFLEQNGIASRGKGRSVKLTDLDETSFGRLQTALQQKGGEEFIGPVYLLRGTDDNTPLREVKEFSTVLNACGRMGKAGLGIGVCLGDKASQQKALLVLDDYRREIIQALEWFYQNKKTKHIIEGKGYTLINAEEQIRDTIIGTLTSLVSKSHVYPDGTIIMSTAHTLGGEIKMSARVSGFHDVDVDLRKIVKDIVQKTGGYGGGHRLAAGATIPQDKEDLFIATAKQILETSIIEEKVAAPVS